MAINKKLIHFKRKEVFDEKTANNEILDTSIVFIQDSKEISTHGTIYKSVNWSVLGEDLLINNIYLSGTNESAHGDGSTTCSFSYNTEYPVNQDITITYTVNEGDMQEAIIYKNTQSANIITSSCEDSVQLISISPENDGKYHYILNN